jgi:hypothetical protein
MIKMQAEREANRLLTPAGLMLYNLRMQSLACTRTALLMSLIALAGCVQTGPDVKVLSESPAQIEYTAWCGAQNCISRANVIAMAEQHCQQSGLSAKLVDAAKAEDDIGRGERFVYKFNCAR